MVINSRNLFHWPIFCHILSAEFFVTHCLPWQSHLLTAGYLYDDNYQIFISRPRRLFWVWIGYKTFLLIFNYPIGTLTTDPKLNIPFFLLNLLLLLFSLFQGFKQWSHPIFQVKNLTSYIWLPPLLNLPLWQVLISPININS